MYASDTFQGIFRLGLRFVFFQFSVFTTRLFRYICIFISKYTNGEVKEMVGKTTIWHAIQLEFSIIFVNFLGKHNCRQPSK